MVEPEDITITFPCDDYPIKIMGVASAEFREHVLATVEKHAPGFDASRMVLRDSNAGTYQSVTLWITATGKQQLSDLNDDLRAHAKVKMVL